MPSEKSIRFCIAGLDKNIRAASWKLWSPPNKNDIYLAGRELKGAAKISLHQSGSWHLAYDAEFYDQKVPDDAATDNGRFIHTWNRPVDFAPEITLALRIVTPWTAIGSELKPSSKIHYVNPPDEGEAVEIAVFITSQGIIDDHWFEGNSLKSKLIGSYLLPNCSTVWVVHHNIECPDFSELPTNIRMFKDVKKSDIPRNLRAMAFGDHNDGSKIIYDLLGKVSSGVA